ncbi:MAG TPA: SDR family oxidoreductase [Thermoanaerobaculia bacterium]
MRVLILGAGGMLGHKVWQIFRDRFDCRAAVRTRLPLALFDDDRVMAGIDAADFERVTRLIAKIRPDAVINCVGVVKQLAAAHDPIASITLNSLFPHVVARACGEIGARMIHISTDCVFAGTRRSDSPVRPVLARPVTEAASQLPLSQAPVGLESPTYVYYSEADLPDATDLYGRSKLLGEVGTEAQTRVSVPHSLTIRTSIIGRELRSANGVVEWFLLNRGGAVRGYTKAVFSGVTTTTLAQTLADVIEHHPDLNGLYHVAGSAITKYDLLIMLNEAFGAGVAITPDESVVIDRTLDATRFREATGMVPPSWQEMIVTLAAESPQYERWRRTE